MKKKNKWALTLVAAVSLLLLLAAACAAPAPTPTPTAVPPAKQVIIGMSQEPDTLGAGLGSMYVAAVVKNALGTEIQNSGTAAMVWRNDKNEIIPGLAESVPTFENGGAKWVGEGADRHIEVTYKIRKGIKWHDGNPVTAADAKFAWETVVNPDFPIPDRSQELKIAAVTVVDNNTITYVYMSEKQATDAYKKSVDACDKAGTKLEECAEPYLFLKDQKGPVTDPLYNRIGYFMPTHILSKIAVKDIEKSEYARKPVGMGAYKFKEWVPGQSLTLEANPDFFLGAPKIQTLIFKIIPDTNTILAQLQTGDIDVATEDAFQLAAAPDLDNIAKAGVIKPYYTPAMVWEHIDFNLDNEFLKDANVRKAIAQGVDRQAIVDKVLYGKTQVAHSWITPNHWAYSDAVTKYAYSKDEAKKRLEAAGFTLGSAGYYEKGGKRLKLKLTTTAGNKARELTTQIIQSNLKEIGVEVELEYMPSKQFFATDGEGPLSARTFEMGLYAWVAGDDPGGMDIYHSSNIPTEASAYSGQNFPGYKNAKNDDLLVKANAEMDESKRKPLYAEQQKQWTEDLPSLPLYQRVNVAVAKVALKNFRPSPTNTPPTWNVQEWFLPAK